MRKSFAPSERTRVIRAPMRSGEIDRASRVGLRAFEPVCVDAGGRVLTSEQRAQLLPSMPLSPLFLVSDFSEGARAEGLIQLPPVEISCAEGHGGATQWVRILSEGPWLGHPSGALNFSRAMFEEIERNFRARKTDTVVDREHATRYPGLEAPAAGWVKDLRIVQLDDGRAALEALVEWTERAADQIRRKEYRYVSPTILSGSPDPKTGQVRAAYLHSVALTNTPFLDDLPELRLHEGGQANNREKEQGQMEELLKALAAKLRLQAGATQAQIEEAISRVVALSEERGRIIVELYKRLDLSEGATMDQAIGKVISLKNPAGMVPVERFASVEAQLRELGAERLLAEAKKKIAPAMEPWARELALKDPAGFKAWAAIAPDVIGDLKRPRTTEQRGEGEIALSEEQANADRQLGITAEDRKRFAGREEV